MIYHLVLCQLSEGLEEERIDWMLRQTRLRLLKIPEVLQVRCGRGIDQEEKWPFFFAVEFFSTDQLAAFAEHPVQLKFVEEVLLPYTVQRQSHTFEMEPGKDLRFS